jgi:diguanylate cyclase (GGDEF)-like protein
MRRCPAPFGSPRSRRYGISIRVQRRQLIVNQLTRGRLPFRVKLPELAVGKLISLRERGLRRRRNRGGDTVKNWYQELPNAAGAHDDDGSRRTGLMRRCLGWLAGNRFGDRSTRGDALERTVADLNSRQKDMAFLGEVGQLFQACRTVEEVCNVARDRLQSLSPKLSGALYLVGETKEYLENAMSWGAFEATGACFAPSDCWAVRRGRAHQVSKGHDAIACAHTDTRQGDWHLCVPLMAQGEALGILYFRVDAKGSEGSLGRTLIAADRLSFYFHLSETMSLAVANMRLRESLQQQAIRDPLTGLFNRRYFQETLSRELHRAARAKQPLSLVMIDVDHFKRFNDTYGHDAGDATLKAVGEILLSRSRAGDVASRYGGEEFVLALPGLAADVAAIRVEALRREIEMRRIQFLGQSIDAVTISAGIAVYPSHAMDMDGLMHAADQALYQSKNTGRNRFTMAGQPIRKTDLPPLALVHSLQPPSEHRLTATGGE